MPWNFRMPVVGVEKYGRALSISSRIVPRRWPLLRFRSSAAETLLSVAICLPRSPPQHTAFLEFAESCVHRFVNRNGFGKLDPICHPRFGSLSCWHYDDESIRQQLAQVQERWLRVQNDHRRAPVE